MPEIIGTLISIIILALPICFIWWITNKEHRVYSLGYKHGHDEVNMIAAAHGWKINLLRKYREGYKDGVKSRKQEEREREEFLQELEENV